MHVKRKVGVAAAAIVTLLIAMATPAAADGPFKLAVDGGTLSTILGDFDLTPGSQGEVPCQYSPEELALKDNLALWTDNDASGPGTWAVTGNFFGQFQLPANSGTWYQADFTILGAGGDYWANPNPPPPPDYFLDGSIAIQVRLSYIGQDPFDETPPSVWADCSKENDVCTVTGFFVITYGEFNGDLPDPNPGDFADIDAETLPGLGLATSDCSAPFTLLEGSDAAIWGLILKVV